MQWVQWHILIGLGSILKANLSPHQQTWMLVCIFASITSLSAQNLIQHFKRTCILYNLKMNPQCGCYNLRYFELYWYATLLGMDIFCKGKCPSILYICSEMFFFNATIDWIWVRGITISCTTTLILTFIIIVVIKGFVHICFVLYQNWSEECHNCGSADLKSHIT